MRAFAVFFLMVACGGSGKEQVQVATICPAGSMLDPSKQQCIAMEPTKPVVAIPEPEPSASVAIAVSVTPPPPPPPPPPPTSGFAIDVKCTFPQGWVALLPAAKYPKDDQFLMQSLIGLTSDPHFWGGLAEYAPLKPFAAQRCASATATRLLAPATGDYYLLAGQEGTFSARGKYDKNGVRRKMTVNATQAITLGPGDLVHTWDCISCPWIVFHSQEGDREPFVVLANRRGRDRRGTDVHAVNHVEVAHGRITLRVMEVEQEDTHLDKLVLRMGGQALVPESVLARDDGAELRLAPHTQATVTYAVPSMTSGFVDVEVEATGYYDPR